MASYISISNQETVPLKSIPVVDYTTFYKESLSLLEQPQNHCVSYYGFQHNGQLKFVCAIGDDEQHKIHLLSYELKDGKITLPSLTEKHFALHIFEREISENWGVTFENHPWPKPVRYAHNRADLKKTPATYPFYKISGDGLHEVGVGPIHAGIIEPGHFRFLCIGEMVLHLEIQLGWQHRGVEALMVNKTKLIQRTVLAESITGDTAIGHNTAFCQTVESLGGITASKNLELERAIALELERIAIHVGDLSAMCTDVAYQLGSAGFGALRTPIINMTQAWCGNRFGKGLVRPGGTHFPLTKELVEKLQTVLTDFEWRFDEIADRTFNLPSILKRFEGIGRISNKQVNMMGSVGMVAKMSNLKRDTRHGQPFGVYKDMNFEPILKVTGDVWARASVRKKEISQSLAMIREWVEKLDLSKTTEKPVASTDLKMAADSLTVSLTEGWRGEICHVAVTDTKGELMHYKIKDPSMHNWKSLELSLRDLEISDFPINNKSYDLSYCGHDL
tara:strand:- start:12946 stop:14460 length:1515 start_codon:yes stop_codon:yes gene_type:complete